MFAEPDANIAQLGLQENEVVADFGAGSGAYTVAAAKALHGTGRVYAVEIQKDLLTRMQNTARSSALGNIQVVWGNIEKRGGTKLPDNSLDVVILSNVLFQTDDKKATFEEVRRVLRPGGRLLLVDWTASFGNLGPVPDHIFTEVAARALAAEAVFLFDKVINAGNYHYGLIFRKGGMVAPETRMS
jgi:ubiquinone/menaquinone biosynthesis C-methylase UbiE